MLKFDGLCLLSSAKAAKAAKAYTESRFIMLDTSLRQSDVFTLLCCVDRHLLSGEARELLSALLRC